MYNFQLSFTGSNFQFKMMTYKMITVFSLMFSVLNDYF